MLHEVAVAVMLITSLYAFLAILTPDITRWCMVALARLLNNYLKEGLERDVVDSDEFTYLGDTMYELVQFAPRLATGTQFDINAHDDLNFPGFFGVNPWAFGYFLSMLMLVVVLVFLGRPWDVRGYKFVLFAVLFLSVGREPSGAMKPIYVQSVQQKLQQMRESKGRAAHFPLNFVHAF